MQKQKKRGRKGKIKNKEKIKKKGKKWKIKQYVSDGVSGYHQGKPISITRVENPKH